MIRQSGCRPPHRCARGSVPLFVLAFVSIASTAALGVYKAYIEFIDKPRTQQALSELEQRTTAAEERAKEAEEQMERLRLHLWRSQLTGAAAEARSIMGNESAIRAITEQSA